MEIFDGNFASYLIPIVLLILFSLPDALRRKRKYPKRKYPKQTKSAPKAGKPMPAPREGDGAVLQTETKPAPRLPKKTVPAPAEATQPARTSIAVRTKPPAAPMPVQDAPPAPAAVRPVKVSSLHRPEPWSSLSPQARDLYAGIVWSELLQPPAAYRRKKR